MWFVRIFESNDNYKRYYNVVINCRKIYNKIKYILSLRFLTKKNCKKYLISNTDIQNYSPTVMFMGHPYIYIKPGG